LWLLSIAVIADRPVWQRIAAGIIGLAVIFTVPIGAY